MTSQQPPDPAPHRISMCAACERVPVPVHFVNWGKYRGLSVCAVCLAEEGIHLEEREVALWLDDVTPEVA